MRIPFFFIKAFSFGYLNTKRAVFYIIYDKIINSQQCFC